jgi:hypothetical protein
MVISVLYAAWKMLLSRPIVWVPLMLRFHARAVLIAAPETAFVYDLKYFSSATVRKILPLVM